MKNLTKERKDQSSYKWTAFTINCENKRIKKYYKSYWKQCGICEAAKETYDNTIKKGPEDNPCMYCDLKLKKICNFTFRRRSLISVAIWLADMRLFWLAGWNGKRILKVINKIPLDNN